MRLTTDLHEFAHNTQMIRCHVRLKEVGVETRDILGAIWPDEVARVRAFCARHPDFHIVSYLGEATYLNRYDERGALFFLAEGDSDPTYMLDANATIRGFLPAFMKSIKPSGI